MFKSLFEEVEKAGIGSRKGGQKFVMNEAQIAVVSEGGVYVNQLHNKKMTREEIQGSERLVRWLTQRRERV